ncbi:hypothetical protein RRG08_020254 [Elysia crispata]|uniref:Uncharacterized protein n=1 Tax=Elysia crispata TaxID=231223 RepID=A0AAE1B3V9_9GAST|nr:hypothetical protein RRG08_020254 [Elysia crispata]
MCWAVRYRLAVGVEPGFRCRDEAGVLPADDVDEPGVHVAWVRCGSWACSHLGVFVSSPGSMCTVPPTVMATVTFHSVH